MRIQELIQEGIRFLEENQIEDSKTKARILAKYVLKKTSQELTIDSNQEIKEEEKQQYKKYLQEIKEGKPLQYVTHTQEFMGLDFYVDENVLIPQPDTEILVEETIKVVNAIEKQQNNINTSLNLDKPEQGKIRILDLCTGSGIIAISLAKYLNNETYYDMENNQERSNKKQENNKDREMYEIYGLDISNEAIKIAQKNAKQNKVEVSFFLSDMFEKVVEQAGRETFDIIVSNPPYIEKDTIHTLSKEVQNEPHIALDGGEDGLTFYRTIAKEAHQYLKKDGYLLVEIGYNQKESVTKLFEETKQYGTIYCIKDLAQNDRVLKIDY